VCIINSLSVEGIHLAFNHDRFFIIDAFRISIIIINITVKFDIGQLIMSPGN
jgi:hypothetical protein